MSIKGRRIIVLGAGGFIGANLTIRLSELGAEVTGYGRTRGHLGESSIAFVQGDPGNADFMASVFDRQDMAVYLLGTTTPASSNEDMEYDVRSNLLTALAALQGAAEAGVRRFVLISSGGSIYGPQAPVPTPETAATDPICSYAIVKLAIEKYLRLFEISHGMKGLALRAANPYGPFQRARKGQGAVAAFIEAILRKEPIHIWGDGSVRRDYLYVGDLVEAIVAALGYEGPERVFNIGSGASRSLNDVVETLREIDPAIDVRYESARAVDVPVSQLLIERAAAELDWRPGTDWRDGIRRTYAWLRDNVGKN